MNFEFKGTVEKVLPLVSGTSAATGREWKKRDFVVEHIAPGRKTNYRFSRIKRSSFLRLYKS